MAQPPGRSAGVVAVAEDAVHLPTTSPLDEHLEPGLAMRRVADNHGRVGVGSRGGEREAGGGPGDDRGGKDQSAEHLVAPRWAGRCPCGPVVVGTTADLAFAPRPVYLSWDIHRGCRT